MEEIVAYFTKRALEWSGGEKITKTSVMRFEPGTLGIPNYTASYSRRPTCSEYSVLRSTIQRLYGSVGGGQYQCCTAKQEHSGMVV